MGNESSPHGEISSWSVAGFGSHDEWYVTPGEHIDDTKFEEREFTEADLLTDEAITVHFTDEAGNDYYYTVYGPFEDWESFEAYIEDLWEDYGGEAG